MNIRTTLTRIGGGTLIAAAATVALAAPSTAMSVPPPGPGSASTSHPTVQSISTSTNSSTDWQDVGLGIAGGLAFAGAAYGASTTVRHRRRQSLA